ncbi:MAG: NAD(P)/FAD-dependent oxidoreductase [Clostridiales bacterium]|nr:NAD(P)/FAD-dependent oxidoreductase [Clostridiales bacterium]
MGNHVIIIGGGAAGMVAAISAKRQGARVMILERNSRVGKKILATGNGRCNFTNIHADAECYSGKNSKFVYTPLASFSVEDTLGFFEKLGIQHKVEDGGKVYPKSDQASSILDVLLYELERSSIKVVCDAFVTKLSKKGNKFMLQTDDGKSYEGDRVILATGGKAMPSSGSDGNGLDLAAQLGHNITDLFPALVQLMLEGSYFKRIDGVKFVGTAEIIHNNKSIVQDRGDILFTNYGISGPPVLQISRIAGELLSQNKKPQLKVVIMDDMDKEQVSDMIQKRIQLAPEKSIEFSFVGWINKRLIPVVLLEAGINSTKRPVSGLSLREIESIARILTDWRFSIRGTKSWPSAQITAGGIDTRQINADTMESKLVEGLYIAGEIIDIDGLCGGFNLQWAWTSGYIAGQNSAW